MAKCLRYTTTGKGAHKQIKAFFMPPTPFNKI